MQNLIQFFTAAMQNMNFRYDDMNSRILDWQNVKNMKAKLVMERKKVWLHLSQLSVSLFQHND